LIEHAGEVFAEQPADDDPVAHVVAGLVFHGLHHRARPDERSPPCDNPAALQEICDRLQPGTIEVFAQRWLARLPLPFGPADQRAGYWWEISMRQAGVSRTLVFDAPRRARAFFEALIADNLDVGRPASVEIIFGRRIRRDTPGVFRTGGGHGSVNLTV
jgi:hypothetical protein